MDVDPRTGLVTLDPDECIRLLRTSTLGRLAIVIEERPLVFPVNFTLDGHAVVLRTDEGTKLYAARHGFVAFECDDIDRRYHTGWSVIISGKAEEIREPVEIARLERLPLGPWAPGRKQVWLRIRPHTITGRRIPPPGHTETDTDSGPRQ